MAIISLDNKTYLTTALQYANDGLVSKALALLAKCDSYQGHINRLVLLFLRGDFAVANTELCTTIAKYAKQYNVLEDLTAILTRYDAGCIAHIAIKGGRHTDSKKNIAEHDIVVINQEDLEPLSEIFEEEIDFFELADILNGHRMYDIKSVEYLNYIKYKAYLMYAEGKQGEANKLIEQILDTKTDNTDILMWKVMVLSNVREYDKAMNIAEKIYDKIDDITQLCYIAECLREGCGNKVMLHTVIDKILVSIDSCSSDRVVTILRICNDYLVDYTLASRFANFILHNYQYFPIDSLRDAIWVFLNCGDIVSAKEATMALLRSVPQDVWSTTVLAMMPSIDKSTVTSFASVMPPLSVRGIALPRAISHYAVTYMSKQTTFDNTAMRCMRGVANHCKVLSRQSSLTSTLLEGLFYQIEHTVLDSDNIALWQQLVSEGLLWALYPMDIMVAMLARLVDYGYSGQLHVNLGKKIYKLDTSMLLSAKDDIDSLKVICTLALISNMTKLRFGKYMSCLSQMTIGNCYLAATIVAEQCGVKPTQGSLDEIAEILQWNTEQHAI